VAKTQAAWAISPLGILAGGVATDDDARRIVELENWAAGYRPKMHVSAFAHPETAYASDTVRGMRLLFDGTAGAEVNVIRTWAKINPDVQSITVAARCSCAVPDSVSIKFYVGSANTAVGFVSAVNGTEQSTTILTSSTGTGWQSITVALIRVGGGSGTSWVETIRIQDAAITSASSLPDPQNS
jgi:hypothetical protein